VYEVAAGVYRMPLPLPNDGLRAVNVYVLVEPDGLVLRELAPDVTTEQVVAATGVPLTY